MVPLLTLSASGFSRTAGFITVYSPPTAVSTAEENTFLTTPPQKKLFVQTHGCQMNEYDSARMADLLGESHGLALTDRAEDADVLLLNTC